MNMQKKKIDEGFDTFKNEDIEPKDSNSLKSYPRFQLRIIGNIRASQISESLLSNKYKYKLKVAFLKRKKKKKKISFL